MILEVATDLRTDSNRNVDEDPTSEGVDGSFAGALVQHVHAPIPKQELPGVSSLDTAGSSTREHIEPSHEESPDRRAPKAGRQSSGQPREEDDGMSRNRPRPDAPRSAKDRKGQALRGRDGATGIPMTPSGRRTVSRDRAPSVAQASSVRGENTAGPTSGTAIQSAATPENATAATRVPSPLQMAATIAHQVASVIDSSAMASLSATRVDAQAQPPTPPRNARPKALDAMTKATSVRVLAEKPGSGTAAIELKHPRLGRIRLELVFGSNDIEVRATTMRETSAVALRASESALRASVAALGLKLRNLRVSVKGREPAPHRKHKSRKKRPLDMEA